MWNKARRWVWGEVPPSADEPGLRRRFELEGRESNVRTLRRALPLMVVVHVLATAVFTRVAPPTPAHAQWLDGLMYIHSGLGFVAVSGTAVAIWERPAWVRDRIGDLVGAAYVIGAGVVAANAQRANPNLTMFAFASLTAAFLLHLDARVFVGSLVTGGGIVFWGLHRFARDPAVHTADTTSLGSILILCSVGYVARRNASLREIAARMEIERLNASLSHRVAEQVREAVARAREVEVLNTQLNHKVRERSRELTMALAHLAAKHDSLPRGAILGDRVQIERPIGRGGMGAVYSARDLVTGKIVAVKVVQAGSAGELDDLYRFLREAQALASLTHPAIVRSFHVDVADNGQLFQVMELVTGESLEAHLDREETIPSAHVARLGAVLAAGLSAAHAEGIVHRDVKPANVMLTRRSPGLKLLDFGVSKLRDARQLAGGTAGNVVGTLEFLSPEQVDDPAQVTDRADVYQLGIVLYLCLSGRLPYVSDSARSWLAAHALSAPIALLSVAPDVEPEMARLVMRCLAKSPADRPSAAEIAAFLTAVADAAGTPSLEELRLCAPSDAGPGPSGPGPSEPFPEDPPSRIIGPSQPWRRTLRARRGTV